jgi:cytochrome P450
VEVHELAAIPDHVPPERVIRFNFREDEALRDDPWGYIAALQDRPDIFFSPDLGGYWVVTRADLIGEVFSRHDLFTATSLNIPKLESPMRLIPNHYDPPLHTTYRKVMASNLFSPRALSTLEADTRLYARALFDGFEPGRCEFVHQFAYRLPIDIFLTLMGADLSLREECLACVRGVFRGRTSEDTQAGFVATHAFVTRWLIQPLEEPARNQGAMFHAMINSTVDDRALSFEEMHAITMMLFFGGLDTVTSQMTHIMRFLADSPEHRHYLLDHPQALPAALEEMLRRFGISFIGRAAAKDFDYHGVHFRAGDPVCAATPIAGLDPRAFPDPLKVDFNRGEGRRVKHLGFGSGPHLCIGAYLARTQLTVMLEELLPRMPGLRLAPGSVIKNSPGATMMLESLPLEWGN